MKKIKFYSIWLETGGNQMEYMEFKGKTKNDAITEACRHFSVPSDKIDYEVIDEGKTGFLGMGSRPALIKARIKEEKPKVVETVEFTKTPVVESVQAETVTMVAIDVEAVTQKFCRMFLQPWGFL